jgi:site-specific recombinase XerD
MTLNEMTKLFLDSRKRGVAGARKKCSEKTVKIYRNNLQLWMNFMAQNCSVTEYEQVRRTYLINFYDWMDEKVAKKDWSRPTVLQILRSLKAFFRWVDADEDCREAGIKGVQRWLPVIEKTPRRIDIPQMADIKRFANSFNTANPWHYRDYVATCLLLTNGIRIGELCNLLIDCMKLEECTLIVTGKTGTRLVPITKEMVGLLKGWMKRRATLRYADSPYVFISRMGQQMDTDGFVKAFLKHRKKYNLPRISAHSFRHVFCTHYLKNGGDIEKLRNITGHSSYDMLMDYLHLAKVGGKEAHAELERVNILKEI